MEKSPDNTDRLAENMIQAALHYLEMGFRPIPLEARTKKACVKWKRFQTETPTEAEVRDWFGAGDRPNIALVTGEIVVADLDDANLLDLVMDKCGKTEMLCRTPRGGFHAYYRARKGVRVGSRIDVKGKELDLRAEGAYAVCPWSRTDQGNYEWIGRVLPVEELPVFKVAWTRERTPVRVVKPVELTIGDNVTLRRAAAYLSVMEGAVSGNGGHARTFRAACVLCQKFSLTPQQAFPILWEWNVHSCEPVWTEQEIWHKLNDAWAKRNA